ncbi:MAG: hypothetical protein M1812_000095 [Candelaria pacifica]|nr:MAG: hypothetical protein M1812_000095 [Candelaria pacifica]
MTSSHLSPMYSYDVPASIEERDEMIDGFDSAVWQGLGQSVDDPDGVQLNMPMALDPILLEPKSMYYLPQQPWVPKLRDWDTIEDRPQSPSYQTQDASIEFAVPKTNTQRPNMEGPDLSWLTNYLSASEQTESELEQLDDSDTLTSHFGTHSASSTQSSNPLGTNDRQNALPESGSATSFSPFGSLGLTSDCLSSSSLSQAASTSSSPLKDWLEDGSFAQPSPSYFSDAQAWGTALEPSVSSAWLEGLLTGDRRHEESTKLGNCDSTSLTACSEHAMCNHRNIADTTSISGFPDGCNPGFPMLMTEHVSPGYDYTPTHISRRLKCDGPSFQSPRLGGRVESQIGVHPYSFTPLGISSAWSLPLSDDENGSLHSRTQCRPHSNVRTRSHFNHRPSSPESTRERGSRQRDRLRDTFGQTLVARSSRRMSRNSNTSSAEIGNSHRRRSKDAFLVKSKVAGMSYKEIKARGHFTEAESTLRGRFRALTKNRKQRVRKPEWTDRDIELLLAAVEALTGTVSNSRDPLSSDCRAKGSSKPPKIPWKQVADCIASRGGSYHFGNATCRKKWDDIQSRET